MFESAPKPCTGIPPLPQFRVEGDRPIHCAQQILFLEGLLQEIDGTTLHGTNAG